MVLTLMLSIVIMIAHCCWQFIKVIQKFVGVCFAHFLNDPHFFALGFEKAAELLVKHKAAIDLVGDHNDTALTIAANAGKKHKFPIKT